MNRSSLGGFGRELPPDELSHALAAVGVLVAADGAARHGADLAFRLAELIPDSHALVRWRLPSDPNELSSSSAATAAALASAWRTAVSSKYRRPRLLVELPGPVLLDPWLLHALYSPPDLGSVIFSAEPAGAEAGFCWPLRLGFLDDAGSDALRGGLGTKAWWPELVEVGPAADQPDILVLPHGLRGALRATLNRPGREQAVLTLVLGGADGSPAAVSAILAALRGEIAAGGIAVVDAAPDEQPAFVEHLVENLAHNLAADEALFAATAMGTPPPLLVASRAFAESARISWFVRALVSELESFPTDQSLVLDDATRRSLGLPEAPTGPKIADALSGQIESFEYPAESTTATWIARLRRSADAVRRLPSHRMLSKAAPPMKFRTLPAPPPSAPQPTGKFRSLGGPPPTAPTAPSPAPAPRPPRKLQADVFEKTAAGELARVREALLRDSPYVFSFMIGEPGAGRAEADAFIDDSKLPHSESGHDLTVVFAETPARGETGTAQVGTLHLPPEGDSDSCTFAVRVASRSTAFEGRVTVLFENRVLETALVEARVSPPGEARCPLELRLASLEVDGIENAGRQPALDGALVFNETASGDHAMTGIAGDVATIASLAGIDSYVTTLGTAIDEYTDLDRGKKALSAERMTALMTTLALPGHMLWKHVMQRVPAPLRSAPRLHLVEAVTGALLPAELFYRAPAPLPDAKPCPGGPPVGDRACSKCLEGPEARNFVCANQFWGFRTVFERVANSDEVPAGALAKLRKATTPSSSVRLESAVLGTSELVDAEAPKKTKPAELPTGLVQGALAELVEPGKLRRVHSLQEWEEAVKELAPGLIVLVVHKTKDDHNSDAIEISGNPIAYANTEYAVGKQDGPGPIVLLIGCSTATAESGALGLVPWLILNGASAVVATLATVRGKYAAPATAELLRALAASKRKGATTLGEALLQVKRDLIARGEPIGMALVAYGDASVVF